MGRIYNNLKRIKEKIDNERDYIPYQELLNKFVTLLTYEDTYLGKRRTENVIIRKDGNDIFLDCGGFGVVVDSNDNISTHT